ncbi:hypothetical protein [Paenibacillus sp. FSL H7-0331]|uniref:hypothetical protein n=1 Tax=Paenibacillus sp. FSL H7-0331 TaxID=1920421 RepID=UPI0015C3544C|nr:hypothetical protein [Paenibacillus sp. FSL H7-0331]
MQNTPNLRISQKGLSSNGQTEAQNDIAYEVKLSELEILQSDIIDAVRQGRNMTYTADLFRYRIRMGCSCSW